MAFECRLLCVVRLSIFGRFVFLESAISIRFVWDFSEIWICGLYVVFCSVKLRRLNRDIATEFTRIVREIPEVTECYNISGDYDYLLKIHAPDMKYYQEFIINVLGTVESMGSLMSTFVMDEVKHEYGIPL